MHRFSIIVPMSDDQRSFDDTLASVLRYRADNCQVIVVHNETFEDSYGLGNEVEFIACEAQSSKQRSDLNQLFNEGLVHSKGEFIGLIRPGVELDENWDEAVSEAFEDRKIGCVTPLIVSPAKPNAIVAAGVKKGMGFCRKVVGTNSKVSPRKIKRFNPIGPTSWAGFYRASALDQIGHCGEQVDDHYLDLDIALSLKTLGYRNVVCGDCVAYLEQTSLLLNEKTSPHGQSAQRAYRRHERQSGTSSPLIASLGVIASEILSAPFQPWKLRHAAQRLATRRLAAMDTDYADQLATQAQLMQRTKESGIGVHEAQSELGSTSVRVNNRRAA